MNRIIIIMLVTAMCLAAAAPAQAGFWITNNVKAPAPPSFGMDMPFY